MSKALISRSDVEDFIKEVCAKRKITYKDLLSKSRLWKLVAVRREVAAELLARGMTLKRVGEYLKKDHTTIYHYIKDLDIPTRRRMLRPDIKDKDVVDLITAGFSYREVAESYNVTEEAIRYRMKRPIKEDPKDPS